MQQINFTPSVNRLARLDEEIFRLRRSLVAGRSWLVESSGSEIDPEQAAHGRYVLDTLVRDASRLLAVLGLPQPAPSLAAPAHRRPA